MNMFRPFLVGFVLVLLFLAGCSGPQRGGILVTIVDIRPTDATLLETRATLTLRYTNENISPLGFSGSRHKLYLNGSYVGTAVSNQPFGIPPVSSVTQDVTVNLENLALIKQLVAIGNSQAAAYRLESVLFQTIDDDRYDFKAHAQGSLDLRSLSSAVK